MAQAGNTAGKRKNTAYKAAASKKTSSNSRTKTKKAAASQSEKKSAAYEEKYVLTEQDIKIRGEVKLLLALGATVLLFLSNFGMLSPVGNYLSYFMFGMVGVLAYALPVLLFIGTAFLLSNAGNRRALIKFFSALAFFWFFIALIQLAFSGYHPNNNVFYYYFYCGENKCLGGFFGALLVNLFCRVIGTVGTYLLLILFMISSVVVFTERSFINGVKKGGKKVYISARDDVVYRIRDNVRDNAREKEYQKSRRIHKVAKGVNLSRIEDPAKVMEEMHEINQTSMETEPMKKDDSICVIETGAPKRVRKKTLAERTLIKEIEPEESGIDEGGITYQDDTEPDGSYETYDNSLIKSVEDVPAGQGVPARVYVDEEGNYHQTEQVIVSEQAKNVMERPAYSAGIFASGELSGKKEKNELGPDGAVEIAKADVENVIYEPEKESMSAGERKHTAKKQYVLPNTRLLNKSQQSTKVNMQELRQTAIKLEEILKNFGVKAKVTDFNRGPSVTRYEIQPEIGTRLNKITTLADDIKLNLAATDIRIEPIPGKSTIGIEVPNKNRESVLIRELIESKELAGHASKIAFAAGKDIAGQVVVADIAKMPHFLIAGTTGSGKSVFTNSIIMSILFRAKPDEVRLIIVDPKVVEFGIYNGIPHLLQPVVTDPRLASNTLKWAVAEMSERYKRFAEWSVRDLKGYNEKVAEMKTGDAEGSKKLPQIVIVIDELADLMMVAAKEVEESICRLAQLARAAGIHLIIATQRPSVDVVTGLIKANIPSRCALMVSSGVDSRTIIDSVGAEKLLGNGDMLFYPSGYVKPVRLQGAFVSDAEVERVVAYWKEQANGTNYDESIAEYVASQPSGENDEQTSQSASGDGRDIYFMDAARLVIEKEKASTSMIQRVFKIGFNRAARIVEQLEKAGIVGAEEGTKPRRVLMSQMEFENFIKNDTNG